MLLASAKYGIAFAIKWATLILAPCLLVVYVIVLFAMYYGAVYEDHWAVFTDPEGSWLPVAMLGALLGAYVVGVFWGSLVGIIACIVRDFNGQKATGRGSVDSLGPVMNWPIKRILVFLALFVSTLYIRVLPVSRDGEVVATLPVWAMYPSLFLSPWLLFIAGPICIVHSFVSSKIARWIVAGRDHRPTFSLTFMFAVTTILGLAFALGASYGPIGVAIAFLVLLATLIGLDVFRNARDVAFQKRNLPKWRLPVACGLFVLLAIATWFGSTEV